MFGANVDYLMELAEGIPFDRITCGTGGDRREHCGDTGRNHKLKAIMAASLDAGESPNHCASFLLAYDKKHHSTPLFSDSSDPQMRGGDEQSNVFRFISSNLKSINAKRKAQGLELQQFRLTDGESHQSNAPPLDLSTWGADRYRGEPPPIEYLVENKFSLGKPALLAAMGGAGKGMSILDLAVKIGTDQHKHLMCESFGERVMTGGTAVIFAAEDSRDTIHRRLNDLDPDGLRFDFPNRIIIVPFPDAGGCPSLMQQGKGGKLEMTDAFKRICDALAKIDKLRMVAFDPISPMFPFDLSKPEYGQAAATPFCTLAAETGACVIATHHMRKNGEINTVAEAREAIRGSSSIVDGLRLSYALWPEKEDRARKACKALGEKFDHNKVFRGAVVKKNGPESMDVTTYIRNEFGLLVDRTQQCRPQVANLNDIKKALIDAIAEAACIGQPFTHTGINGVGQRSSELPEILQMGRLRLEGIAKEILDSGDVVKCLASGTTVKWLDVPCGPFAKGDGIFVAGKADQKGG